MFTTTLALMLLAAEPALAMSGDLPKPATLTLKQLEAAGTVTETVAGRKITGVPLQKLLEAMGHDSGPKGKEVPKSLKHSGHRKIVIAHARDGFEAVFSTAELDETVGTTKALVIWAIDGKPIEEKDGPFKLAVTTDHSAVRSIYQLDRIEVRSVTSSKSP